MKNKGRGRHLPVARQHLFIKVSGKKKKPAVPAASKPVHTKNTISGPEPVQKPASVFPEKQPYSAALAAKAKEDDAFADVIFEAETYFRKELSVNDIEILIYIHDQLGFSTEIMEYLIEYCVSIEKPDLRYAEGIAKNWYQAGIHTLEEAKEAAEMATHCTVQSLRHLVSTGKLQPQEKSHGWIPGIRKWALNCRSSLKPATVELHSILTM